MDGQVRADNPETDGVEGAELITLNEGEYIVFDARLVHAGGASTRGAVIAGEKHTDLGTHFYLSDDAHEDEQADRPTRSRRTWCLGRMVATAPVWCRRRWPAMRPSAASSLRMRP